VLGLIGDSITDEGAYAVDVEDYLRMCGPVENVKVVPLGTGGETAAGFLEREADRALAFGPTVATVMFGMNDGGYAAWTEQKGKAYGLAERGIVAKLRGRGVRQVVLASPSCVDTFTYKGKATAGVYNETLAKLGAEARATAEATGVRFVDVNGTFAAAMAKAKGMYGESLDVAGADGIHPSNNGHLVIAYAMLKGLGMDGDLGTLTMDMESGDAAASGGHRVISSGRGTLEVESTRYPFCFMGVEKESWGTVAVPRYVAFNEDLNRLMLVVKHAGAGKVKVTWGGASKAFDGAALEKGINLAAEFVPGPFNDAFFAVEKDIRQKQHVQEGAYHAAKGDAGAAAKAMAEARALEAGLAGKVRPVRHRIVLERVK
jgi:lysophospholipase L1-like esterase